MALLQDLFSTARPVIGVVHLLPLPTSPRWAGSLETVLTRAEQEATALASGGVNGIIIENYFDAPFVPAQVDPAVVSAMSLVVKRVMRHVTIPVGINVLRNDARAALAISACTGAQFIRVNVLTGAMVTDQGIIEGEAHKILRYRRELGTSTLIFADILVKHGTPLGPTSVHQATRDTVERGLADAVILSGAATGDPPGLEDLEAARSAVPGCPVLIGSGATIENVNRLLALGDGVIVASALKRHGQVDQPIDPQRARRFVEAVGYAGVNGLPIGHAPAELELGGAGFPTLTPQ